MLQNETFGSDMRQLISEIHTISMNLNVADKVHVNERKNALGDVCSYGEIKSIVNGDFLCFRNICVIL